MKRAEALLYLGMVSFVLWLLIAIVYPWAGFALGVVALVTFVGFIFLMLLGFIMARRA
jgi:uncharacterized membrane protein